MSIDTQHSQRSLSTNKNSSSSQKLLKFNYRNIVLLGGLSAVLLISGCTDRIAVANNKMKEIREAPAQPIDPPPEPEVIEDFVYSAREFRSPFIAPSVVTAKVDESENTEGVRPDLERVKEPLEEYELAQLVYRGSVVSPDGKQYGLVQRPDNSVTSVQVGEYLGLNNGRIVEITPTQINLIEIVPDSRSGFVEKPQSLISPVS